MRWKITLFSFLIIIPTLGFADIPAYLEGTWVSSKFKLDIDLEGQYTVSIILIDENDKYSIHTYPSQQLGYEDDILLFENLGGQESEEMRITVASTDELLVLKTMDRDAITIEFYKQSDSVESSDLIGHWQGSYLDVYDSMIENQWVATRTSSNSQLNFMEIDHRHESYYLEEWEANSWGINQDGLYYETYPNGGEFLAWLVRFGEEILFFSAYEYSFLESKTPTVTEMEPPRGYTLVEY